MICFLKSLIPQSDKFYVAVSGGVDSIVCLHLLHRIYKDRVAACHINHAFQPANDEMQKQVERFCIERNIELRISKRDPEHKITSNVESLLREYRLSVFNKLEHDVIMCHHLNDAVESYIMNTLKGCPEWKPIPTITQLLNGNYIRRPFIKVRKSKFEKYATNNDLWKYIVEDPTNQNNKYRRNMIRNELLPMLSNFGLEKVVEKKFYSS